uniref:Uncharacterized protein n=1 Tax=Lepeophtheirus salmonis TaxID=72036 RepID=A0A0K2U4J2_LEPSM
MSVSETYKYLGIQYSPLGVQYINIYDKLRDRIKNLETSKLITFHRFIGLRDHLIPRLLYPLTYRQYRFKDIKGCDLLIRRSVREWVKLSHDTPKEFYHVRVADGVLGLKELLISSRTLAIGRARALRDSPDKIIREACKFNPQITEIKTIQIGGFMCFSESTRPLTSTKKVLNAKVDTQWLE